RRKEYAEYEEFDPDFSSVYTKLGMFRDHNFSDNLKLRDTLEDRERIYPGIEIGQPMHWQGDEHLLGIATDMWEGAFWQIDLKTFELTTKTLDMPIGYSDWEAG